MRWPRRSRVVPVRDDFQGLFDALELERRATRPLRLQVKEVSTSDGRYYTVKLSAASAARVREEVEEWRAAGPRTSGGQVPWWAEVMVVDPEHRSMVLFCTSPQGIPENTPELYLYEPDYQALVRRWAEEKAAEGSPLPRAYQDLCRGLRVGPPRVDLGGWLKRDAALRAAQREAVRAAGRPLCVVWGPPGTGKTYTLGSLVAGLSLVGVKVLVLAPTNVAADQAALAVDDARSRGGAPLRKGQLIRPGRPRLRELEERDHLVAWTALLEMMATAIRELRAELSSLTREMLSRTGSERERLAQEVADLKRRLQQEENLRARRLWDLAFEADIIVTTLTSGLYHEMILASLEERDHALVLDESSMIPRYALVPFLVHDPEHLVLVGDLRQLGPIRRCSSQEEHNSIHWVGSSAFDAVGAREDRDLEELEATGTLAMLTEQSRMNQGLCRPISETFYRGRLTTVGNPPEPPLAPGWPAAPCLLVNPRRTPLPPIAPPAGVDPRRIQRENRWERSAWVAVAIALDLVKRSHGRSVLLLSPFRNQADLLRTLVRAHLSHHPQVRAGTVHVAQGQEADLVIFDPVNPCHAWLLGYWGGDDYRRLLCVAFSRPRCQMVVLGLRQELERNPLLGLLCREAVDWTPQWSPRVRVRRPQPAGGGS